MTANGSDDQHPPWQVLDRRVIYHSAWVGLEHWTVRLPDGGLIPDHHVVIYPRPAVGIVPRDAAGRFLLIDHYRFITGTRGWEIPAGQVETPESVEAAAARELLEETGHGAGRWTRLGDYHPSNGSSNQRFYVMLAEDLTQVAPDGAPQRDSGRLLAHGAVLGAAGMKILALSDEVVDFIYSLQAKDRYGDVDLVVGCGDLPFYYLEFVVTLLNKPLYFVPGNHDSRKQYMSDGRVVSHAEGCINLDQKIAYEGGLILAGLGGSIRYRPDGVHQYTDPEMGSRIARLAPRLWYNRLRHGRFLDLLITHSPPFGIHDGGDLAHTGFQSFINFVNAFKPRYLLHGHSHVYRSNEITRTRLGSTEIINVYPYRVIEW
jgi:8-oxo-dGTP pyrophosphatase MutT (NUDIX family)/predicted phosphodiesterase